MKLAKFTDFFKYADFFYTTIGLRPYEEVEVSRTKRLLANVIFITGTLNLNIMVVCEMILVIKDFKSGSNFVEAVTVMSYIGFVLVADSKMFFVWLKKPTLARIMTGLQQIYPYNTEAQVRYNVHKYLAQCGRITFSFSLLYMALIWTYNLLSIVKYLVCFWLLGMQDIEQDLPYSMYIPWDWRNHWSYYVLYVLHDASGYTSAAGHISSDLFLVACVTHIIMHFDYVTREINDFQGCGGPAKAWHTAGVRETHLEFVRRITRYHVNLLDLSDQINEVFGVPLLLNFITSSCVICFVGFQMTIGPSPETMLKLVLFITSSATQIYLICHYGQRLNDASSNLPLAVYNQDWYGTDVRYQKMLILIAQQGQRPVQLKATTFVLVSRATATEIMQISYKFFAVLRTMYGNKAGH